MSRGRFGPGAAWALSCGLLAAALLSLNARDVAAATPDGQAPANGAPAPAALLPKTTAAAGSKAPAAPARVPSASASPSHAGRTLGPAPRPVAPPSPGTPQTRGEGDDPYARAAAGPAPSRLALARALAREFSARSLTLLWLLAHDPALEVAEAAAQAAVARCPQESETVCLAMLHYFDDAGADAPAGVVAREALSLREPVAAMAGASSAERLAWAERAAAGLFGPTPDVASRRLLRLLAEDADPEVQQAAGTALMALDR